MKNLAGKTVGKYGMSEYQLSDVAYQVWRTPDYSWNWYVLKMYQADDDKPYARWFCYVFSPFCADGEMGDVYVSDIKAQAVKTANRMPELVEASKR
jgi:hypothetical protein